MDFGLIFAMLTRVVVAESFQEVVNRDDQYPIRR